MRVIITGRRYNVSTRMKSIIEQKLEKIKFFYDHILSFHVIIEKEKMGFKAEVAFSSDGKKFFIQESAAGINEAIDSLVDKLERQIRKHKDRIQKRSRPERQDASISAVPENIRFSVLDSESRDLLEAIKELAISEQEYICFPVKDTDGDIVAVYKEESDLYTIIGFDAESSRWMEKRVFLAEDEIERTDVLDYLPLEYSLQDAIYDLDSKARAMIVFWNRDDSKMQALFHTVEGQYELITLS